MANNTWELKGATHEFLSDSHEFSKLPLTQILAKGVLICQVISLDYKCSNSLVIVNGA